MSFDKQLIAYLALSRKEIQRFMRIWIQTIVPPAITATLYFLIMGQFIGSQIRNIDSFSYINYIAPGLIMMVAITNSYTNVASSFYSGKFQRHIEELLISPMPNYLILFGFVTGGILRGVIASVVVFFISLVFTTLPLVNMPLAILILILTTTLFSLAGLINGIYARSFDDISVIPTFILTPLTYLGGIFYSIQMLSEFWQQVSLFNPILYMVNGFRQGLLGTADITASTSVLMIVIFIIFLASFCLYLMNKGIGIRR